MSRHTRGAGHSLTAVEYSQLLATPISLDVCHCLWGDQLYLTGGIGYDGYPSISVLTCFLTDLLLPPQSQGARLHTLSLADKTGVWRQARNLPVTRSTLTTLGGHLLAVGGADDSRKDTRSCLLL